MELEGRCFMMDAFSITTIHPAIWDPWSMETNFVIGKIDRHPIGLMALLMAMRACTQQGRETVSVPIRSVFHVNAARLLCVCVCPT